MHTLWLFAAVGASHAAEPLMDPVAGRLRGDLGFSSSVRQMRDTACSGDACTARLVRTSGRAELGAAIVPGLGLTAAIERTADAVDEASYKGRTTLTEVGGHAGLRVWGAFGLATQVRTSRGEGAVNLASEVQDPALSSERQTSASLLTTWGAPSQGGLFWIGAEGLVDAEYTLRPMGTEGVTVRLPLRPHMPVNGVVGAVLMSDRVGTPWGRSPRLRTVIEARIGADVALSVAAGLAY